MRALIAGDDYNRAIANLTRWRIMHAADVAERFEAGAQFLPIGIDEERRTIYATVTAGDATPELITAELPEALWSTKEFFLSRVNAGVWPGEPATTPPNFPKFALSLTSSGLRYQEPYSGDLPSILGLFSEGRRFNLVDADDGSLISGMPNPGRRFKAEYSGGLPSTSSPNIGDLLSTHRVYEVIRVDNAEASAQVLRPGERRIRYEIVEVKKPLGDHA